ncbi:MAG: hypothetical protein ABI321_17460, partial [Polyangia bacterium]
RSRHQFTEMMGCQTGVAAPSTARANESRRTTGREPVNKIVRMILVEGAMVLIAVIAKEFKEQGRRRL